MLMFLTTISKISNMMNYSVYSANRRISFYHHRSKRDAVEAPGDSNIRPLPSYSPPGALTDGVNLKLDPRSDVLNKANLDQSPRQSRQWCKDSHGVFCMLYNVFKGNKDKVS